MSRLPKPCRVLVIDDNLEAAELMQMLLQMEGFVVRTSCTGTDGLSQLTSFVPQVVCIDIGIHDFLAAEVVRQIKNCPGVPTPFLVGMTGWDDAHLPDLSIKSAFDRVYLKPVPMREFVREARHFCNK